MSEDNLENFDQIATGVADAIHDGYVKYITSFQEITRRAGNHFANQEWSSQDQEAVQRLGLHTQEVNATVASVKETLKSVPDQRGLWRAARLHYRRRISGRSDLDLSETFFNSVTRRIFTTIGIDNDVELRWFGASTLPKSEGDSDQRFGCPYPFYFGVLRF